MLSQTSTIPASAPSVPHVVRLNAQAGGVTGQGVTIQSVDK